MRGRPAAEEERFFELLRPEQGKLYRTAWAILGNEADARDALQEAVIRAYRAFSQLKGGEAAFPGWIRRILINQCTQILRRRARVIPVERPEDYRPEPAGVIPEHGEVWEAVRRLPEHYRSVVVLRFLADLSLEDIARTLDIPLGTVKSRLHTALKQLRSALTEADAERRGAL
ncbi:MAG: sigma-70 family RNA polymerase sigma factor [Firmicutes bacterium]|nr:sigma-70 family RNA polymerase sigma factor [Bacillota bacterium]